MWSMLIFKKMNTNMLIPYTLSRELDLIRRNCSGHEAEFNNVDIPENEDEMEGTDVYNDENLQPMRDTDHLSKEMKVLADRYPSVLKDNFCGCDSI